MKAVILETVRAGLRELADVDFQRRVWTGRGQPGEMSSFDEAIETLFDDSGLEPDLGLGRDVLGPIVDTKLRALGAVLERIDSSQEPTAIIDAPLMDDVRRQAAEILEIL